MTADEFESYWARFFDQDSMITKPSARVLWLAAREATAKSCRDICLEWGANYAGKAIEREFLGEP